MKERELRAHAKCDLCQSPIGATGVPLLWTLHLQQHGILADPVRRQTGLGLQVGAHLAMHLGADEEMTQILTDIEVTACADCVLRSVNIYHMAEIASQRDELQAQQRAARAG